MYSRTCQSFGSVLQPRSSSAQSLSTSELLRTLLMVAASEPTSWLFSKFHILRHLVRHWGPQLLVWAVSLLTTGLITRSLTPMYKYSHSQFDQVQQPDRPLPCSVLYRLYSLHEASPKAISGRTSYLHVRLAFHPYPHLIQKLFNAHWFGPPHIFTCASTWTWVDHCGFGSAPSNFSPSSDSLSLRLRISCLTSLDEATRRFILQQARRRTFKVLRLLVDIRFQVLFHSPPGVLFTFPSRYYALSVYISVSPWRVVPPASHKVSRVSWYSGSCSLHLLALTRLSLSLAELPSSFCFARAVYRSPQPRIGFPSRFELCPFRSPLLRVSLLIPFPPATQMFQFTGCPSS